MLWTSELALSSKKEGLEEGIKYVGYPPKARRVISIKNMKLMKEKTKTFINFMVKIIFVLTLFNRPLLFKIHG